MSIPLPLTVALRAARGQRHVTHEVRDLRVRWSVPGGYGPATIDLARPLHVTPEEVDHYADLTVYDARSGQTVYAGRVEDLGRSAGADGAVWQIAAVGPGAHTRDDTRPIIYNDRRLDAWAKATGVTNEAQTAQTSIGEDPGGSGMDAITLTMQAGLPITGGEGSTAEYRALVDAGQKLAVLGYIHDSKFASTTWRVRGFSSISTMWRDEGMSTTPIGPNNGFIGADFTAGEARPFLKIAWTGGSSTTAETWTAFRDVVVVATRYLANGTEKLSGYTSVSGGDVAGILASEVVADLLGRMLPHYDGADANIAATTYRINQLAYPDGVDAATVLEDMMRFHPDHYWAAWERTNSGKYRFEWTAWPTAVRYEADVSDGWNSPSTASELFNRVRVRYRDAAGRIRTVVRTSTVPALDAAGLTRTKAVDLGDEVGSEANAIHVADQTLADHASPKASGTLTVARPILDLQQGRMVQPWEIRPGLIRVRGITPRQEALAAAGRDGVSVFKIVSGEFRASDGVAVLELDSHAPSTARALSDLLRRPVHRRR